MAAKKFIFLRVAFPLVLFMSFCSGLAGAQDITPALQQEFADAKVAIEAAQKAQAEKFSPEPLKKAQDLLITADNAKAFKDSVKFAQASRLARAYAELAKAIAELKSEEEKLAATQEELQKAKDEIEQLKKVIVRGHTDSVGKEEVNQALSEKRAQKVREYLVAYQDIQPTRVTTQGVGPSQPVATNTTEAGRALDRRVEIAIQTGE
ncbi:MAG: OmpA family protein [Deltaproteobacteria bacterium]|nr:OmpA family protein [Deltaproteobacteria bacterium]